LDSKVLVGIIEENDLRGFGLVKELTDAVDTVTINGYLNTGVFAVVLKGFVAEGGGGIFFVGQTESFGDAFVAPAQYGHSILRTEEFNEVFDLWGFAGAPRGEVSDGDNGYWKTISFKKTCDIEVVSQCGDGLIEPSERKE
jgi:hypothetical protein